MFYIVLRRVQLIPMVLKMTLGSNNVSICASLGTHAYLCVQQKVCWHTSPMGTIKMLHLCWLASPTYTLDLIKYADLHHPCIYKISWSMPTYITHGYIWIAWFKYDFSMRDLYVNIHQSLSLLRYIKYNLCWLTSPIGTIRMLYSSMLTCITHV